MVLSFLAGIAQGSRPSREAGTRGLRSLAVQQHPRGHGSQGLDEGQPRAAPTQMENASHWLRLAIPPPPFLATFGSGASKMHSFDLLESASGLDALRFADQSAWQRRQRLVWRRSSPGGRYMRVAAEIT